MTPSPQAVEPGSPGTTMGKGTAVLVTGCSSGIGRQIALALSSHGFLVFATVRREAAAEALRRLQIPNLVPVCPLDLARLDQVSNVAAFVSGELDRRGLKGLSGLVNNAGGGTPAPIEMMNLEEFRTELQARVLGSVAMVQAFLPLLRRGGGRILWIMTPATIPTPYVASIHACDFAVNCIVRTLRIETKRWHVPNIMIKCGGVKTPAGLRTTSDVEVLLKTGPAEKLPLYEGGLRAWAAAMEKFDEKRTDPDAVARIALEALSARRPRMSYSVGYMAKAAALLEAMPHSVTDWILTKRF